MKTDSTISTIRFKIARVCICFVMIPAFLISGCALSRQDNLMEYSQTKPYFGAYVTIRCFFNPKKDISAVIKRCWARIDEIQQDMNVYSETGELAKINNFGFTGVTVKESVFVLLNESIKYSRISGGAFDVTVYPLVELWKASARKGILPDQKTLEDVLDKVGYQKLRLEPPNRVFLAQKGMRLDLGGIVSGYACDEIAVILVAGGINNFLVDTGGEILCNGKDKSGQPWRIGVQDPLDKKNLLMEIEVKDECVSTSGNYEKYYLIGQEKYSHIINPITGYPQKDAISATVISKTGTEADALSTALCVLGGEKSLQLIRTLKNVEILVIENRNGKINKYKSGRFLKSK